MAKGGRGHDRLMGSYSYGGGQRAASTGEITELMEEDVWSMVDRMVERENSEERSNGQSESSSEESVVVRPRRRWAGKDGGGGHLGGLSLAFQENSKPSAKNNMRQLHHSRSQVAASAPINVPSWPRTMVRVDSVESLGDHEDDDDDRDRMPPHEYLAREYAQSRGKAAATSVFEGVGRTLKGRDMSRVRDAVWSQTGFDG